MKPCTYFARGACKYGDSCRFHHETKAGLNPLSKSFTATSPKASTPDPNVSIDTTSLEGNVLSQVCMYHLRGSCNRGLQCLYAHPATTVPAEGSAPSTDQSRSHETETPNNIHQRSDSRGSIPCTYSFRPGGCRKPSCPYLHSINSQRGNDINRQDVERMEDEVDIRTTKLSDCKINDMLTGPRSRR
jgi:hypothetical protein